jgi:hypothetical protein
MKIFGVGLQKTGTVSIAEALRILQFRVFHNTQGNIDDIIESYDAVFDIFHDKSNLFKALKKYPDAILFWTIRPKEKWIISMVIHNLHARLSFAKDREIDTREYDSRWESHKKFVEDDLVGKFNVVKIDTESLNEDGWSKICGVLKLEVPNISFPIKNTKEEKLFRIRGSLSGNNSTYLL